MFCIACGKELPDNSNFCIYCGATTTLHQELSVSSDLIVSEPEVVPNVGESEYPVPVKKNKKSNKIFTSVAFIGLILIGGVIGFFVYQNHIMKQAVNVVTLFDKKEYAEALHIYDKFSGKKEDFNNNVNEELLKRVNLSRF